MRSKSKPVKRVVHRRYDDRRARPDLRSLARCNNINGPLKGAKLTSDPDKVTCGRCRRIEEGVNMNPQPFSNADLRRISRDLAGPPKKTPVDQTTTHLDAALAEAHRVCTAHIHCGTVYGSKNHSALEQDVAKALVAAFYRGKNARP